MRTSFMLRRFMFGNSGSPVVRISTAKLQKNFDICKACVFFLALLVVKCVYCIRKDTSQTSKGWRWDDCDVGCVFLCAELLVFALSKDTSQEAGERVRSVRTTERHRLRCRSVCRQGGRHVLALEVRLPFSPAEHGYLTSWPWTVQVLSPRRMKTLLVRP